MVLDFAKESVENSYPNIRKVRELKELIEKWGYKITDLDNIEIHTCDNGESILITLHYYMVDR